MPRKMSTPSSSTPRTRPDSVPTGSVLGNVWLKVFTGGSNLAQPDPGQPVLGVLVQHQCRPAPGGQDVLEQVRLVDAIPDVQRDGSGLIVGEVGVAAEVGGGLGEGGAAQTQEPLHVPVPHMLGLGVQVDGEVEEVADRQRRFAGGG